MNKSAQWRLYVLVSLPVLLVITSWFSVVAQSRSLEAAAIKTYQEAELEVVRNAARAATVYITGELERRGESAIHDVEQETLNLFVEPIRIGAVGDAWIYSPDYVVFDESEDFPAEYVGKNMAEIFDIQKHNGARHYQGMTEAVMNGRGGVGWYVWEPDKQKESAPWWEFLTRDAGREIAAWTPVVVFPGTDKELTWVIGMSAMLPEIMKISGAYAQVQTYFNVVLVVTLAVFALLCFLYRAEMRVRELRRAVVELRVEIDQAKRAEQVAAIVDSDYFRKLSARAQEMRGKHSGDVTRPTG